MTQPGPATSLLTAAPAYDTLRCTTWTNDGITFLTFTSKYQDQEVVIAISSGEILEGELKAGRLKLVQAWIEIRQDELLADWELASQGQTVFKIEPLK